jgi:phosphatidylserine/phosphatidylglycerophosphate/cardiolipin synthase-like enzyme
MKHITIAVALTVLPATVWQAQAQSRLCDPSFENCRVPLMELIRAESVAIDVAFWFMEDSRYTTALIERWKAGVPIRVLIDLKANASYPINANRIAELAAAGIPIRHKTSSYLHWKTMVFAGQSVVEFSGANYSPNAFVPNAPYVDYVDEAILFSSDPDIVNSFKTKFDDVWTSTSGYANYANVSGPLTRSHPTYPIHADLNFPPGTGQNFAIRSARLYDSEDAGIDAIMYRITDRRHSDALIRAHLRGVPVRLLTEPKQYRDPARLWHAWNVDRLHVAGVQVRHRRHRGLNHEKLTLLSEQRTTILGSSNWTESSANSQLEHNLFSREAWIYDWSRAHFDRKWNSDTETQPFVPLRPDAPIYNRPADAAQNQPLTVTLRWYAGPWAHRYDVYLGTDAAAMVLKLDDVELGPSEHATDYVSHTLSGLKESTTYYWKVVSRTMAGVERAGRVYSFRTAGEAAAAGPGDVVLYAARAPVAHGWSVVADTTAAGGARLSNPNLGAAKVSAPLAEPALYFEMRFAADAGVPYHIWIRGKSAGNSWRGDSAYVQFSDSTSSSGAAIFRLGSTSAASVTIEDCSGCGLSNWGWNDNGYGKGVLGPHVYFAASGTHTIRVQVREDGMSIDQIVLSRRMFLSTRPGLPKDDGTLLVASDGSSGEEPPDAPPSATLPDGWATADVGAVAAAGSARYESGTFTLDGAGADVWGTADEFRFAYQALRGDGSITARVAALEYVDAWTKAGVMVRASATPGAAHAFMLVSAGKGLAFQRRSAPGGLSTHTAGGTGTAPRWVRLVRTGDLVIGMHSADGMSWTEVGRQTIALGAELLAGLAVTSHKDGTLATAMFDRVVIAADGAAPTDPPVGALPAGWSAVDVGGVATAGTTVHADGRFTLEGSGADVWGPADEFRFVHRTLSGDGSLTARVTSLEAIDDWTKAGVMVRASTSAGAPHAFMLVSAEKGVAFQRRTAAGGISTHTAGGAGTAPTWVRLVRTGDLLTGYRSSDGIAWVEVGREVIPMGSGVLIGLAVTSHRDGTLATAVFDSVR